MKNIIKTSLAVAIMAFVGFNSFSQVDPYSPEYQSMKEQGLFEQPQQVNPVEPIPAILPSDPGSRVGGLLVPLDGSFTAFPANDDGSVGPLSLPFDFCFYGVTETSFYVNNNGNVSFGSPYSSFTPSGFPDPTFVMLAPFWADVDTRGAGSGLVWYKIEPNRVVVIWDQVGYWSNHADLKNTFELIFTNGLDPLIGIGNNVAFSFDVMQWTCGDIGGSGGFGTYAATVGVNRGNGVDYALVGLFDHPGSDYDGPGGANDGVSYLDGKYYAFDACEENIIIDPPPPDVPISNWALFIGLFLIVAFAVIRFRKLV